MRRFEPGETAVRRDLFRDRVWSAAALRVVEDGPEALVLCCRPGAELLVPTTWIEWLLTGDETARSRAIPTFAGGDWRLDRWPWRDTAHLQWIPPDTWFSVNAFYEPSGDHPLTHWYVTFQHRGACRALRRRSGVAGRALRAGPAGPGAAGRRGAYWASRAFVIAFTPP